MRENPIIAEIHRHREAVARECEFDAAKLVAYYRRRERERDDSGHPLVTVAPVGGEPATVREEPPAR